MGSMSLRAMDLEHIANCSLTVEEVLRQIDLVKRPPRYVKLQRPCLPGCGIDVLDAAHAEACIAAFEAACAQGRFLKFVAAPGAGGRTGRPGGRQAPIEKLNDLCGDLIFIKNTEDILPDDCTGPMLHWKKVLGGHLVRVQREIFGLLAQLDSTPTRATDLCDALHFVRDALGVGLPSRVIGTGAHQLRDFVVTTLDRPLRICGMVRGDDNLGGGPFWVKGRDGTSTRQIVETAQVDPGAPDQQAVLRAATHFNPVDLVCGVRNWRGEPFDLRRYVDPTAGLIGLWTGAMADWTTLFVEVPAATVRAVKTRGVEQRRVACRHPNPALSRYRHKYGNE